MDIKKDTTRLDISIDNPRKPHTSIKKGFLNRISTFINKNILKDTFTKNIVLYVLVLSMGMAYHYYGSLYLSFSGDCNVHARTSSVEDSYSFPYDEFKPSSWPLGDDWYRQWLFLMKYLAPLAFIVALQISNEILESVLNWFKCSDSKKLLSFIGLLISLMAIFTVPLIHLQRNGEISEGLILAICSITIIEVIGYCSILEKNIQLIIIICVNAILMMELFLAKSIINPFLCKLQLLNISKLTI